MLSCMLETNAAIIHGFQIAYGFLHVHCTQRHVVTATQVNLVLIEKAWYIYE
jgi:hypothetical protein